MVKPWHDRTLPKHIWRDYKHPIKGKLFELAGIQYQDYVFVSTRYNSGDDCSLPPKCGFIHALSALLGPKKNKDMVEYVKGNPKDYPMSKEDWKHCELLVKKYNKEYAEFVPKYRAYVEGRVRGNGGWIKQL